MSELDDQSMRTIVNDDEEEEVITARNMYEEEKNEVNHAQQLETNLDRRRGALQKTNTRNFGPSKTEK